MVEVQEALLIGYLVAVFLLNSGRIRRAIAIFKECLVLSKDKALKKETELVKSMYEIVFVQMFEGYLSVNDFANAVECGRELLVLANETGDRNQEGMVYFKLGKLHYHLCKYQEAKSFFEKALNINITTGSTVSAGSCYLNLGAVLNSLSENIEAKEYLVKALAIAKKLNDRRGESLCYGSLGNVFTSLGEYAKAKKYYEKALALRQKIGFKENEALCYANLGCVCNFLGQHDIAKEYLEKGLAIAEESGDRKSQAFCYRNLGSLLKSHDNAKAKEYYKKALSIAKDIGDKTNEASCYHNLGTVLYDLGKLAKSKECTEKALATAKDIGNREIKVSCYGNLGTVFQALGEYAKAADYFEEALAFSKEIGDKKTEATSLLSLGILLKNLGDFSKSKKHLEKALRMTKQMGARNEVALCEGYLGNVSSYASEEAQERYENQVKIAKEIGSRDIEASGYRNLGDLSRGLGDYDKAKEYLEQAVLITEQIADINGVVASYVMLGTTLHFLGDYSKAREYHKKALCISQEIGSISIEIDVVSEIAMTLVFEGKIEEASSYLWAKIAKFESLRSSLKDNIESQLKISLFDQHILGYRALSALFCSRKNFLKGLCVVEFGRARALADLMSAQYSLKYEVSAYDFFWGAFERCMITENNCAFLYISYFVNSLFLWLFNKRGELGMIRFQEVITTQKVGDVFDSEWLKKVAALRPGQCEDRSWFPSQSKGQKHEDNILVDDQEDGQTLQPNPTLAECYKLFIEPLADCLCDGTEIIIVPDRCLFRVPFAALEDERGKYLSESFRIRIIPSLLTLKLIQDSPSDYHSKTGALIVGDPDIGWVRYGGRNFKPLPLPLARKEAERIGKLLKVHPLLGEKATKQSVLQRINSASILHLATHGNEQRGEIFLAPPQPVRLKQGEDEPRNNELPQEENYMLTMADISRAEVQLRAKLVVLSCYHSANGHTSAEGVVGIAHAFLASGARSVLVALWAIDDEATMQFMSRFYEHLVRGESASESLHQAMKWMRENGFSEVRKWAPFMLIGDSVTFDFGNI